jgi:putative effector of murein hydrolase
MVRKIKKERKEMKSLIEANVFCLLMTLIVYSSSLFLYRKVKKQWFNPLYTATLLLLLISHIFHIQKSTFSEGSLVTNHLLQIAVVALAVPLYKQGAILKGEFRKISTGVLSGTLLGIGAVILLSHFLKLSDPLVASLIPRSVTLPIALTVSSDLGGLASMTILYVVLSGLASFLFGPMLLNKVGIRSKAAKGLAMGTSAQMLGASRSLAWGEEEGAMGSVAMTTTALLFSLLVPFLPHLLNL